MDRSMDSIGSCSLDVDAESSDISDTSGSLNFPTPISIKDITREFTNNIRERCSVQTVKNTTAFVDPVTGQVCIALTQPPTATVNKNISGSVELHNQPKTNNNITATATATTTTTPTPTLTLLSPQTPEDSYDKKPSYLNLACCVNGYSNITTYDSKIRQDINKSREVSPIRPSSSSLQYCKKSNSLAPPILLTMPNVNLTSPQQHQSPHQMVGNTNGVFATSSAIGSKYFITEINNHNSQNGIDIHNNSNNEFGEGGSGGSGFAKRSFIQQRVERLYGPGALAQGFYSPKKTNNSSMSRINKSDIIENGGGESAASELARKFQELSPSKDYNQFRKKLSNGKPLVSPNNMTAKDDTLKLDNNNIDLPCLRHLSQEFRAQLPVISPKRNLSRTSPSRDTIQPQTHNTAITNGNNNTSPTTTTATTPTSGRQFEQILQLQNSHHQITTILNTSSPITGHDELDHKVAISVQDVGDISVLQKLVSPIDEPKVVLPTINPQKSISNISSTDAENKHQLPSTTNGSSLKPVTKDAHFFLKQLKDEQNRLLIMAVEIEKYLDVLSNNPDITEDILGLLRSASGKARLLVSQKMKQFEGLCHNNLNSSPADQFPTTVDDLQGFWDMVYLQVDHIDSIFAEIENLKKNDWKKPLEEVKPVVSFLRTPKNSKTALNIKQKQSKSKINGAAVMDTSSAAALKREAQRKQLQEMKRRNREAMAAASTSSVESSPIDIVGVINVKSETNDTTANQQIR